MIRLETMFKYVISGVFLCWSALGLAAVDINQAAAEDLAKVMVGVGIHKTEAIVQYREAHGPFKSIDELTKVSGIGRKTIEMNRDKIAVESASEAK